MKKLQRGSLSKEDWRRLSRAAGKIYASPFFINDMAPTNLSDIRDEIHFIGGYSRGHQQNLGLIIIDDLKIVPHRKDTLESEHVAGTFDYLRSLAIEVGKPIVIFLSPAGLQESKTEIKQADLVIRPGRCTSRYNAFVQRGWFTTVDPQLGDTNSSGVVSVSKADDDSELFSEEAQPASVRFPRHVCDVVREVERRYASRPAASASGR